MFLPLMFSTILLTATPDEAIQQMSVEEKIGQLFIVPALPEGGKAHLSNLQELIDKCHIGGILMKQGDSSSYRRLYGKLKSPIPLLHVGDAEWGVSMRVKDAPRYPRNLTLGALRDLSLMDEFGHRLGWECHQVGIHLNLAPVVDVNTNPLNPVIGMRSFGDNPYSVATRAGIIISALEEEGIAACAKHFPGHGDTSVDSHVGLPVIHHLQLEPFHGAIAQQVPCILTSHLYYRPLEEVVTFSQELIEKKLRCEVGFQGVIITDALNMGALTTYDKTALKALMAGHDLLLYGDHRPEIVNRILLKDIPQAFAEIQEAIQKGDLSMETLNAHIKRIWTLKQKYIRSLPPEKPLLSEEALVLKKALFEEAITLLANSSLPLEEGTLVDLHTFGATSHNFAQQIGRFGSLDSQGVKVAAIYELTDEARAFLQQEKPSIVVWFTSPYKLMNISLAPTTLIAYESDSDAEEAAVNILFERRQAAGRLPVDLKTYR